MGKVNAIAPGEVMYHPGGVALSFSAPITFETLAESVRRVQQLVGWLRDWNRPVPISLVNKNDPDVVVLPSGTVLAVAARNVISLYIPGSPFKVLGKSELVQLLEVELRVVGGLLNCYVQQRTGCFDSVLHNEHDLKLRSLLDRLSEVDARLVETRNQISMSFPVLGERIVEVEQLRGVNTVTLLEGLRYGLTENEEHLFDKYMSFLGEFYEVARAVQKRTSVVKRTVEGMLEMYREELVRVVGELRPVGGRFVIGNSRSLTKVFEKASNVFPSEWLGWSNQCAERDGLKFRVTRSRTYPGSYEQAYTELIEEDYGVFLEKPHPAIIRVNTGVPVTQQYSIVLHEMCHRFEHSDPDGLLVGVERVFYERRTARGELVIPTSRYRYGEVLRDGGFVREYMGRSYSDRSFEILTTGFEALFTGADGSLIGLGGRPADFDMRDFVLGVYVSI